MGMRIFLSHSHEDDAVCHDLVAALRAASADVWYDEQDLTSGQLLDVIQRELEQRPVFLVMLSKAAFASSWVRRETKWAYELADRDPTRIMLPVTVAPIERTDFSGEQGWLFLTDFKRIEASGYQPYAPPELIARTLGALLLTAGSGDDTAPPSLAPQPGEPSEELLARGKALQAQNRPAEALQFFDQATQVAPTSFVAWANQGATLMNLGRYRDALAAYEHAIVLQPASPLLWSSKGLALVGLRRHKEALAACDRALALDPTYTAAWINKGAALIGARRFPQAISAYEQVLTRDPNSVLALSNEAFALIALRRSGEAVELCDRALAIAPTYARAWVNKGLALLRLERYEDALAANERALALVPHYRAALVNKQLALRKLGRKEEARAVQATLDVLRR